MNRGVLQSSPVQQIMAAGNPSWWNINTMRPPSHQHQQLGPSPFMPPPPSNAPNCNFFSPQNYPSPFPFSSPPPWPPLDGDNAAAAAAYQDHITADSWSQLMSGLVGEEEKAAVEAAGLIGHFPDHHHHQQQAVEQIKQENSSRGYVYGNTTHKDFQAANNNNACWSHNLMANSTTTTTTPTTTTTTTSSPQSCITTFSSTNLVEFSSAPVKSDAPPPPPAMVDPTSECNSSAAKKAKVQVSGAQSTFKVRKFGDRITALHQLVSPFGKTDTASVLLEAIGYIRFLQSQIEALSLPYLSNASGNTKKQQQHPSVQGERNCIFPEDPGQLLNDKCLKRKGGPDQVSEEEAGVKDLRSRGLCLVPVSCTLNVGRDNGADYWAPMLGGFR